MENNGVLVVIPIEKSNPVAVEKICFSGLYIENEFFPKYKDFKEGFERMGTEKYSRTWK